MRYRYADAEVVIEDRYTLLSAVTETVEAIIARIRALNANHSRGARRRKGVNRNLPRNRIKPIYAIDLQCRVIRTIGP